MKIVIVSDTHGSRKNIENVCECNPDADMLIHLGDVEDDADYIEAIFECPTHIVGGNNDFFSRLPREEEFELEGHHIFITHGHAYYVSMGEAHLQEEARHISFSYGVVEFGEMPGDIYTMIREADHRMYQCKTKNHSRLQKRENTI